MRAGGKTRALGTAYRGRRRLPGDTLIEFELKLGLSDKVPVRRRLGGIDPGGRSAGGRDWGRAWWLADVGEYLFDVWAIGDDHGALLGVRYPSQNGHH